MHDPFSAQKQARNHIEKARGRFGEVPRFTAEEEEELWRQVQRGERAYQQLALSVLPMVLNIAHRYSDKGVEEEEIEGEALRKMCEAIRRGHYHPDKGRLITYVTSILPKHLFGYVRRIRTALRIPLSGYPPPNPEHRVLWEQALKQPTTVCSRVRNSKDSLAVDDRNYFDPLDPEEDHTVRIEEREEQRKQLVQVMRIANRVLNPKQLQVLWMHSLRMTYQESGEVMGVGREAIRQMLERSILLLQRGLLDKVPKRESNHEEDPVEEEALV